MIPAATQPPPVRSTASPPPAELRLAEGVRPPQQQRSREVLDRILVATGELLRERQFGEITVVQIARRARCSVGSFYARFPDKESVLRTLEDRMRDDAERALERHFAPERWAGVGAEELVRSLVRMFLTPDRDVEDLLRAFAIHSLTDPSYRPAYLVGRERILRLYREGFTARLLDVSDEVGHTDAARAAGVAFDLLVSVTEQRLFVPASDVDGAELEEMLLAYLAVAR